MVMVPGLSYKTYVVFENRMWTRRGLLTKRGRETMPRPSRLKSDQPRCENRTGGWMDLRSDARLMGLRVRILLRAWIFVFVFVVYHVGSVLCDELITRREGCYRLCVSN